MLSRRRLHRGPRGSSGGWQLCAGRVRRVSAWLGTLALGPRAHADGAREGRRTVGSAADGTRPRIAVIRVDASPAIGRADGVARAGGVGVAQEAAAGGSFGAEEEVRGRSVQRDAARGSTAAASGAADAAKVASSTGDDTTGCASPSTLRGSASRCGSAVEPRGPGIDPESGVVVAARDGVDGHGHDAQHNVRRKAAAARITRCHACPIMVSRWAAQRQFMVGRPLGGR